ncbi:hypothetical protein WMY93_029006 [Mugilogobius chulae]|uniref:C3/C5 convertase n=1 Tax=Mugilogobius chulae TaxID=88201 RepID=A0AAW0MPZ2_9GOBI
MLLKLTLSIVLASAQHVYSAPRNCSTSASINGGHVTYSEGGQEGSVLTYHCRLGQYPFPVSFRTCRSHGQWTTMRLSNGRPVTRAICKDVMCPGQLQLDNGHFWPRDLWFRVGSVQTFSCVSGFTLHGSAHRNCTDSGEWTGTTPICKNYADDCDDPGTPPGAHSHRFSGQFFLGDRVSYTCQSGLELLGSALRECLEHREWSGSTPRCQSSYMFDSPSAAAAAMAGSLAGVMDVLSPEFIKVKTANVQRVISTAAGSRLNVFILLDTSGSISSKDFELSKDATIKLIRKLASYEVQIKYDVLSFASKVIKVVEILNEFTSAHEDRVIDILQMFDPKRHGTETGTNLFAALSSVNERLAILKQRDEEKKCNETQNVLIIQTDGFSNIGNKSSLALNEIRTTLGYDSTAIDHTHERLLDVYVFGLGPKVNKDELNSLASKKRGEEHLFVLKDYEHLGQVFNQIVSDKTVTICGIAQEEVPEDESFYTHPWHVTFSGKMKDGVCSGSILSPNWVLTAAHCFGKKSTDSVNPENIIIIHGESSGKKVKPTKPKRIIMHPKYDTYALRERNVKEFYDYDVALVEVNGSLPLSWKARPICLPCTVPANRAMKKVNSTCEQHRNELIPPSLVSVSYIQTSKNNEKKDSHIHTGNWRRACVEMARHTLNKDSNVTTDEYVPERFFCAGGTENKRDSITCKGDSGGSVFLQKRNRFFQVGVVSWGTHDCKLYRSDELPPEARDFHIDVFKIMPWLKSYLGKDIQFLSDVD